MKKKTDLPFIFGAQFIVSKKKYCKKTQKLLL